MTKMSKKILACPWVGEFGWEIFCWSGIFRSIKENSIDTKIVCFTRSGRELLYEDFSEVEFYNPSGAGDMWMQTGKGKEEVSSIISNYKNRGYDIFPVKNYSDMGSNSSIPKMKFIKFGNQCPSKKYDILIHARKRDHRSYDNWCIEKWQELVSHNLGKIGMIGLKSQTFDVEGVDDLRDLPLKESCDYLRSSSLIVGPSSGPMHLATLCDCPQVVWSNRPNTLMRYEKTWNPFEVKAVTALEQNPTTKKVMAMIEQV